MKFKSKLSDKQHTHIIESSKHATERGVLVNNDLRDASLFVHGVSTGLESAELDEEARSLLSGEIVNTANSISLKASSVRQEFEDLHLNKIKDHKQRINEAINDLLEYYNHASMRTNDSTAMIAEKRLKYLIEVFKETESLEDPIMEILKELNSISCFEIRQGIRNSIDFQETSPEIAERVRESFGHSPTEILLLAKERLADVRFTACKSYQIEKDGRLITQTEPCSYCPQTETICMNKDYGIFEFRSVALHEIGHHIDHRLEHISSSSVFIEAFNSDLQMLDPSTENGKDAYYNLLNSITDYNGICGDRRFMDIAFALFPDNELAKHFYTQREFPIWSHDSEYWMRPGMRLEEAFANLFSIRAENYPVLVQKAYMLFPELTRCMDRLLVAYCGLQGGA